MSDESQKSNDGRHPSDVVLPNPYGDSPNINTLFAMFTAATGLSKEELIDGAINPEKQPELLRKVSENAKPRDTFKEAVDEMNRD